ncbi:MAG TPA: hypothetical protein VMS38_33085 [Pseudorhodoferax sp.]|nr:hypothetical protein [Pseudorhodoferax sp.]
MLNRRHLALNLLLAAGIAAAGPAAIAPPPATHNAAAFSPIEAGQLLRRPFGTDLVELAYSARQNALFVAAPNWEDETRSRLLRLDPATLAVTGEVALTGKGFGVALDDTAGRIYLTQAFNGAISVVDIQAMQLVRQVPMMEKVDFAETFQRLAIPAHRTATLLPQLQRMKMAVDYPWRLREMVVDTQNERVFAPGLGLGLDSTLVVLNTRNLQAEKIIEGFGYNAVGIALDARRGRVFVSNMRGQVFVVDARTLQITATLEVEADQLLNMVYDPAGNRLIGVDQGIDRDKARLQHLGTEYQRRSAGHRVFVLDADTGATLANLPSAQVPIGLLFDGARQRLYVANRGGVRVKQGTGALTVYDMANYALLQTLALAPHPNSLALDDAGGQLFVSVKNDENNKQARQDESVVRIRLRPGQ